MSTYVDADKLRNHLSRHDTRRILEELGFRLESKSPDDDGWISNVMGPRTLGEGKHGNFSVNLETGYAKDHGSTDYEGKNLFKVVQDVRDCSFPEALNWIVESLGINREKVSTHFDDPSDDSDPESNRASTSHSSFESDGEDTIGVSTADAAAWSQRLTDPSGPDSKSAKEYLVAERGVKPEVLDYLQVGLAEASELPGSTGTSHPDADLYIEWWITIPVFDEDEEAVEAIKLFAFDPEARDWQRNEQGEKLPKIIGSVTLLDPEIAEMDFDSREQPLLLVEGEIDLLSALSHGFDALTGTGGAKTWKPSMTNQVARKNRAVIVCYDGDEAGRKGARKVGAKLAQSGIDVQIAPLPDGKDVNDLLLQGGSEALQKQIEKASPPKLGEGSSSSEPDREITRPDPLPESAYHLLPPFLKETASIFDHRHRKDVFLTGALGCISSCMPKMSGYYGSTPERLGPNLYVAIVAGAAGGKGVLKNARLLAEKVDAQIYREYEVEREAWENRDEELRDDDPPPERSLFLPANTSAAALHKGLKNRGERALIIETEIDTLVNALDQEWGKFDDTLRKGYHHERTSYRRKSENEEENVVLSSPRLSVVLSGTPRQFKTLVGSTESGLYSRFLLYHFESPPIWDSQQPSSAAIENTRQLREDYSERVYNIWDALRERESTLNFEMTDDQWQSHDAAFGELMDQLYHYEREDLADVVKRAGIVAFRVAMISTVLRLHSENPIALRDADLLEATDKDVRLGIELAKSWARHSLYFAIEHLETGVPPSPRARRIGIILSGVADRFSSREAYQVAEDAGINVTERTLRDDLKHAANLRLIRPGDKRSTWVKTS